MRVRGEGEGRKSNLDVEQGGNDRDEQEGSGAGDGGREDLENGLEKGNGARVGAVCPDVHHMSQACKACRSKGRKERVQWGLSQARNAQRPGGIEEEWGRGEHQTRSAQGQGAGMNGGTAESEPEGPIEHWS